MSYAVTFILVGKNKHIEITIEFPDRFYTCYISFFTSVNFLTRSLTLSEIYSTVGECKTAGTTTDWIQIYNSKEVRRETFLKQMHIEMR